MDSLLPNIDEEFHCFIRAQRKGALVIKGAVDEHDARTACDIDSDAIIVSNHGGRSPDGVASTAAMLPRIRAVFRAAAGADPKISSHMRFRPPLRKRATSSCRM
jgi:isopentenyl diphosphate isomerase/L-lactate dehydrogenase-like FMN-dependent dehydrogenase